LAVAQAGFESLGFVTGSADGVRSTTAGEESLPSEARQSHPLGKVSSKQRREAPMD